eukprot:8622495-Pyramimonas_sp.AAC.1
MRLVSSEWLRLFSWAPVETIRLSACWSVGSSSQSQTCDMRELRQTRWSASLGTGFSRGPRALDALPEARMAGATLA